MPQVLTVTALALYHYHLTKKYIYSNDSTAGFQIFTIFTIDLYAFDNGGVLEVMAPSRLVKFL